MTMTMTTPTAPVTSKKVGGKVSPHAGKKIKKLFTKQKELTAALAAVRGKLVAPKVSKILEFAGKKVESVLGLEVVIADKAYKITSADLSKASELKFIELV